MLRKYGKYLFFCFLMIISVFSVISCKKETNGGIQFLDRGLATVEPIDETVKSTSVPEVTGEAVDKVYQDVVANTKKLTIYCINDNANDIEMIEALVDEKTEINPVIVVEKDIEEFSNHDLKIKIDKVSQDEEGKVTVSFAKDCAPVKGVSKEVEYLILDCISQSILDNVETSSAVIFQIEGTAYKTSHISFGKNEAYNW